MNTREFARSLATLTRYPKADLEARARYLREKGFLPQGGHGVNAPAMDIDGAAYLLLGMVSMRGIDAAKFAPILAEMVPMEGEIPDCPTFFDFLCAMLDPETNKTGKLAHAGWIFIYRDTFMARVGLWGPLKPDGTHEWSETVTYWRPGENPPGGISNLLEIRSSVLRQLSAELSGAIPPTRVRGFGDDEKVIAQMALIEKSRVAAFKKAKKK